MKKIIFSLLLLNGLNSITAQELGYGALIGYNAYDVEIVGPLSAESGKSNLNVGGFVDYQLNSSFGLRGNLIYSSVEETGYSVIENYITYRSIYLKTIQLQTLVRYDVNREYNKGFYLTGGLRVNHILSANSDNEQLDGLYKKVNLGAMFGFGVNIAKHFGIEFLPEVNLTNTLDSDQNKTRNYGFYANLTLNLESMLRK